MENDLFLKFLGCRGTFQADFVGKGECSRETKQIILNYIFEKSNY